MSILTNSTPADSAEVKDRVARFQQAQNRIKQEVHKVIVGQDDVIENVLISLFVGGHCLLTGLPGTAKTLLVRTLARALGLKFNRIQFTPDLMPSDITGTDIIEENKSTGQRTWTFVPGPIFSNVLLADEINRTPPKTQSALLEAMQELTCTVRGNQYKITPPFFVLATQNPIELEGTYPLPEAQLDRFLFKLLVPFPNAAELAEIARRTTGANETEMDVVASGDDLTAMSHLAREVPVAEPVMERAVAILLGTHPDRQEAPDEVRQYVRWGASPRGLQTLVLAGRIRALLEGRYNLALEDLEAIAAPALRHRIFLNFEADAAGVDTDRVVEAVLKTQSSAQRR
jgi:MoxR-like ATPase